MPRQIGLVDMDGTLADYDGAMKLALEALRSPDEPPVVVSPGDNPPWIEARRRVISMQPGFWRGLKPLEVGFMVLKMLQDLDFEIHVLTKGPTTKPIAWSEKREWCHDHLPGIPLTITERKDLSFGRVLVDDWMPYVLPWLEARPRGIAVVPAQPWNEGCDALVPGRIIRFDGTDTAGLRRVLAAVNSREPRQVLDVRELLAG